MENILAIIEMIYMTIIIIDYVKTFIDWYIDYKIDEKISNDKKTVAPTTKTSNVSSIIKN